jgi:hypothetical protein
MTTDVLKLSGDYKVITTTGGTLTLDVGGTSTNGTVVIDGNLNVLGVQTVIESVNATIKDNILILNSGETNTNPEGQVTLGTSGIMVARGFSDASTAGAFLVYDDNFTTSLNAEIVGKWKFGQKSNGKNIGVIIEVNGIVGPSGMPELGFFGDRNPNAVLSVRGTTNYQDNVTDPDHIPNKAYVDAISGSALTAEKIIVGNSFVEIHDPDVSTSSQYYSATPYITAALGTSTNVVFELQGSIAQFKDLSIAGTSIEINNPLSTSTITLSPGVDGVVQVEGAFRLENVSPVVSTPNYTGIYSTSTVGGGGTGVYFVNTQQTDELVSRRRSIVYSIIF